MAQTTDDPKPTAPLTPKQFGYAFDHLPMLAQQVLYGRAHGVSLLAAACANDTPVGIETRIAYGKWHEAQIHTIAKMEHDLARWYFTSEAQNVSSADIIRALNLPMRLDPNLSEHELAAACATFVQMLQGERYDLSTVLSRFSQALLPPAKGPEIAPTAPTQ